MSEVYGLPPFLPSTTCVCQHHRRETAALRGRLCPPPLSAWTSPPGKTSTRAHTHTHGNKHTSTLGSHLRGTWRSRLTWSQRAISRVFQRETPVVSSRFMLPRNTTRFTRWFLQLACWWRQRWGESLCIWPHLCDQCFICVILELFILAQTPNTVHSDKPVFRVRW